MTVSPPAYAVSLLQYRPGPALAAFKVDGSPLILVRAANGAGKSLAACAKVARYMVEHPGAKVRIVGPSRSQVREVTGWYLWTLLRPYLASNSRWLPGTGWTRNGTILCANGSTCELKSYQDDPDTQEGRHDLDLIVLDEVPPKAHFDANKGRAKQLIVCMTVQTKAPPVWLREMVEGDDPSPSGGRHEHRTGWVQYVVPLLRENVPFYTSEQYESKIAKWRGTEEEPRRIWASWESSSSTRRLGGWSGRLVKSREEILAMLRDPKTGKIHIDRARYGIDHGTGIGKQCQYLILVRGTRFFVVHEYIGGGSTTPTDNAAGMRDAFTSWLGEGVQALYRVERVYGDVNNAGPAGAGDSLNMLLERALCQLYGIESLPWDIRAPSKAPGWKDAREVGINHAMLEGRWIVCDTCTHAIRAYAQYEGAPTDPFKDPIDGQGYAVQDLVLLRSRAPGPPQTR